MMISDSTVIICTCLLALASTVATDSSVDSLEDSISQKKSIAKKLNDIEPHRVRIRKRRYNAMIVPYPGDSFSILEASRIWKPQTYTISRPYFIPVLDIQGRSRIFYPPQTLYENTGFPQDNSLRPNYLGPPYLPPKENPPTREEDGADKGYLPPKQEPTTAIPGSFPNRINEEDPIIFPDNNDDLGMPIWSNMENVGMHLSAGGVQEFQPTMRPTRMPPGQTQTRPPLIHGDETAAKEQAQPQESFTEAPRPGTTTRRPSRFTTTRTTPYRTTTQRTTPRPSVTVPPSGPSNCIWAIVSCCSASNPKLVSDSCFEQRGCPGPFWGPTPCQSEYAKTAIESLMQFYGSRQ